MVGVNREREREREREMLSGGNEVILYGWEIKSVPGEPGLWVPDFGLTSSVMFPQANTDMLHCIAIWRKIELYKRLPCCIYFSLQKTVI